MEQFKVIIVEDVQLELKGTEQIFRDDIPEATIIGTASNEAELWKLMRSEVPDLVLLDLGLGGDLTHDHDDTGGRTGLTGHAAHRVAGQIGIQNGIREATQNSLQKATQNGIQNGIQNGTQNGTREATQNAIFICEIKDLI